LRAPELTLPAPYLLDDKSREKLDAAGGAAQASRARIPGNDWRTVAVSSRPVAGA
jgi:hypothetical protein